MMKRILDTLAVAFFSLAVLGTGASVLTGCAGWGKTSCQIVDAASSACTVLRFMGEDGKLHEVPLTSEEANQLGRSMAAKKASEKK